MQGERSRSYLVVDMRVVLVRILHGLKRAAWRRRSRSVAAALRVSGALAVHCGHCLGTRAGACRHRGCVLQLCAKRVHGLHPFRAQRRVRALRGRGAGEPPRIARGLHAALEGLQDDNGRTRRVRTNHAGVWCAPARAGQH